MAKLFDILGANFDARLAAHASSIAVGDKARAEFRATAESEFIEAKSAFEKAREEARSTAQATHAASTKAASGEIAATRDAIVNASANGIVDTIADFVTELEANQIAINDKIAANEKAHIEKIAAIETTLGPASDFADNYGAELPAYSADDYSA